MRNACQTKWLILLEKDGGESNTFKHMYGKINDVAGCR